MIPNISIVEQYTRIENFHCFSNISFANNNYNAIHTEQDLHTYTYLSNEITDYNNNNPSFLGICNNHYTIQSLSSTNDFKPLTALALENYFRNENNNVTLSSSSSSSSNNNNIKAKALAVFIRQNTFYLFFNNNRLISINTGLSINYSNILQNGEIIIDIYPYEGPLLTLTNFGRVIYNENLQCIDILGNGTEIIGFLMEDYNIYFSELKINKKKVIFEFKVFNLKDLNNSIFNDNKLIDYTFHNITMNCYIYQYGLQKLMNVLIYFERKYFITKENVNFTNQLLLKTNDYNTSDISFSFLK
ncbi:hypothetical protein ABK040_007993 [Willaertia magna]